MAEDTKPKSKPRKPTTMRGGGTLAGAPGAMPTGTILSNTSSRALFAPGSRSLAALEADVSGDLAALAPTFGGVLLSIGNGVATSQQALDQGLVQTANALSNTNITVVTDVVQELNDDGLPVPDQTDLVTQNVSLINFVRPTAHQWSHVALTMDMSVGAFDEDRGMTVRRKMDSTRAVNAGLFLGFLGIGVFSTRSSSTFRSSESEFEANWAEGRVRMDALLQPRPVDGFDPPAKVTLGPQVFLTLGSVDETIVAGVVTERSLELLLTVRKADGSVNPLVGLDVDPGPFDMSFATDDGFTGSQTNADGQCKVTISRSIPSPLFQNRIRGAVTVSLGQVQKKQTVSL